MHKTLLWPYYIFSISRFHCYTHPTFFLALTWQPVNALKLSITRRFPCLLNPQLDLVAMFTERKTPCPFSKAALGQEKGSFNCLGTTDVYHCLLDEKNRSGEICHQPIWVSKGKIQCILKKIVSSPLLRIISLHKLPVLRFC